MGLIANACTHTTIRTGSALFVKSDFLRHVRGVRIPQVAIDRARAKNAKHNTRTFQQRFRSARGGRERLQALIFAKCPDVLGL